MGASPPTPGPLAPLRAGHAAQAGQARRRDQGHCSTTRTWSSSADAGLLIVRGPQRRLADLAGRLGRRGVRAGGQRPGPRCAPGSARATAKWTPRGPRPPGPRAPWALVTSLMTYEPPGLATPATAKIPSLANWPWILLFPSRRDVPGDGADGARRGRSSPPPTTSTASSRAPSPPRPSSSPSPSTPSPPRPVAATSRW